MQLLKFVFSLNTTITAESFITWCNDNHLQHNISGTSELVVDYSASSMDVAAKKL